MSLTLNRSKLWFSGRGEVRTLRQRALVGSMDNCTETMLYRLLQLFFGFS